LGRSLVGAFAFTMTICVGYAAAGGHIRSTLSPGAFLMVAGGLFALSFAVYGLAPFKQLMKSRLGESDDNKELRSCLSLVAKLAPMLGVVGCLLGTIHTMYNLADPSKIGAGIAVAFISLLYGSFFSALAYGLLGLMENKGDVATAAVGTDKDELSDSGAPFAAPVNPSVSVSETKRKPVSFFRTLLGISMLMAFILVGQAVDGGHASSLLSFASFSVVLCATWIGAVSVYGVRRPWRQFKTLFYPQEGQGRNVSSIRGMFRLLVYISPLTGFIGVILGFIHTMENLSDPSKIGSGIAIAFISMLYGIIQSIIAYVMVATIDEATDNSSSNRENPSTEPALFGVMGFFIIFALFFVVMYSISELDKNRDKEKRSQRKIPPTQIAWGASSTSLNSVAKCDRS